MLTAAFFDSSGKPIQLGGELGRGGEGIVYDINGQPQSVAKIYIKPLGPDHRAKLTAMTKVANAGVLRLAAWPTSTLHDKAGAIVGFAMPKVSGHSPVFKLYGRKLRLQEFPTADWRFLIQAASNAARAFSTIHGSGLVIGDVNHGNLVVARDSTVRFIDCDSFQISSGSKTWFCEVGVGTHQPPEMQKMTSYAGVNRTPNHDNFGLAIIIFQLLCMARHPFSGVEARAGEAASIEDNIFQSRYAYSRDRRRTQLSPPPGSLAMDALTPDLQDLFEAAFAPASAKLFRPTGDHWVAALDGLRSTLRECPQNKAHYYISRLSQCPWCQIESAIGLPLFPVIFMAKPGAAAGALVLWQEMERIQEPPALPPFPEPSQIKAKPSFAVVALAADHRRLQIMAYTAIIGATALAMAFAPAQLRILVTVLIGALTTFILNAPQIKSVSPHRRHFEGIKRDLAALRSAWVPATGTNAFQDVRNQLRAMKAQHDNLATLRASRLQTLGEQQRQKQFQAHLDRFPIGSAKISGIGSAKAATLASHGIDTAGDVVEFKVMAVPGFGAATTARLMAWRKSHERTFRFNPNQPVSQADLNALERDIAQMRAKLEQDVSNGIGRLRMIVASAELHRRSLEGRATEVLPKYAQAEADSRAVPREGRPYKWVIGLAGATTCLSLYAAMPPLSSLKAIVTADLPAPSLPPPASAPPAMVKSAEAAAPKIPFTGPPHVTPTPVAAIVAPLRPLPSSLQPAPSQLVSGQPGLPGGEAATDRKALPGERMVSRQAANVRLAPNSSSAVVRVLPQGVTVSVFGKESGWVQVGDDKPWGWVFSGLLAAAQ